MRGFYGLINQPTTSIIFFVIRFTKGFKVSQNDTRGRPHSDTLKNQSTDNGDGIPLDILYNKNYSISIVNNRKLYDGLLDRSLTVSKVFKPDGTFKTVVFSSV